MTYHTHSDLQRRGTAAATNGIPKKIIIRLSNHNLQRKNPPNRWFRVNLLLITVKQRVAVVGGSVDGRFSSDQNDNRPVATSRRIPHPPVIIACRVNHAQLRANHCRIILRLFLDLLRSYFYSRDSKCKLVSNSSSSSIKFRDSSIVSPNLTKGNPLHHLEINTSGSVAFLRRKVIIHPPDWLDGFFILQKIEEEEEKEK